MRKWLLLVTAAVSLRRRPQRRVGVVLEVEGRQLGDGGIDFLCAVAPGVDRAICQNNEFRF